MTNALRTGSLLAAVFTAAGLFVHPASAATLSCTAESGGGPDPQTVFYQLSSATDVQCFSSDNDEGTTLDVFGMTYTLGDKEGDEGGGDGTVFFTDAPTAGETAPGSWAVDTNLGGGEALASLVIVLKQANSFAAFLIEDGILSGDWQTAGPGDSTMGLSHASAWYKLGNGTTVIPLPASLPLLLAGLGGLGYLGWRRRPA